MDILVLLFFSFIFFLLFSSEQKTVNCCEVSQYIYREQQALQQWLVVGLAFLCLRFDDYQKKVAITSLLLRARLVHGEKVAVVVESITGTFGHTVKKPTS